MSQLGFDETDGGQAVRTLVEWGLVEPDSLLIEELKDTDAVRVHASGFIHLKFLLPKLEYLVGISPDLSVGSREIAERIGSTWVGARGHDINMRARSQIARKLWVYFKFEYERRCRRHPFYEELGLGAKAVINACESTVNFLDRVGPSARARLI